MISTPQSRPKASASRPRERAPGGLVIPVRATLAGYVRWRVLDERGHPEAPRNPAGTALASPDGVLQPNLITNLGLNQIAFTDALETRTSVAGWRRRLAVGTGSTTPAVTDTVLDAMTDHEKLAMQVLDSPEKGREFALLILKLLMRPGRLGEGASLR